MRLYSILLIFVLLSACGDDGDQGPTTNPRFDAFIPPSNDMGADARADATADMQAPDLSTPDMPPAPQLAIQTDIRLRVGETLEMMATRVVGDEAQDVSAETTWNIDDPDVATIDENGLLSAEVEGVTLLTATYGNRE